MLEAASNPMPETSATLAVLGRRVPVVGQGIEQLRRRRSQHRLEVVVELFGKWGEVRPPYSRPRSLELSELLSPVGDHLKPALGPASSKLLDALAAYRDWRPEDR